MSETGQRALKGWDKVLIGCGIGCGLLLVVVMITGGLGMFWMFSTTDQLATEAIVPEEPLAVIRLHEIAGDPGVDELLRRWLVAVNEAQRLQQREQLPDNLGWLADLQSQQADPSGLNIVIPRELTLVFSPTADGDDVHFVAAANFRTMVRFFKTLFRFAIRDDPDMRKETHRDQEVYIADNDLSFAFVGTTVLFSDSPNALADAVDRMLDDGATPRSRAASFDPLLPEGDWDAVGLVTNHDGTLYTLLGKLDDTAAAESWSEDQDGWLMAGRGEHMSDAVRLGFGLDVVTGDEAVAHFLLDGADGETAAAWSALIAERTEGLRQRAVDAGMQLELEQSAEGTQVEGVLRLTGLAAATEAWVAESFAYVSDVEAEF